MSGCEILKNKKVQFGHKVSHSKIKTCRKFRVNSHKVTLCSDILNNNFVLNVAASTLRSINLYGLDDFIMKTQNFKLTDKALALKKRLVKYKKQHSDTSTTSKAS